MYKCTYVYVYKFYKYKCVLKVLIKIFTVLFHMRYLIKILQKGNFLRRGLNKEMINIENRKTHINAMKISCFIKRISNMLFSNLVKISFNN